MGADFGRFLFPECTRENNMPPKHWSHDRKNFYKYMSAETAKIVLQTGKLRWSSPVLFNDPFDVQFDLHIEYDRESVVTKVLQIIIDGYEGRVPIAAGNLLGDLLAIMRDRLPGKFSGAELRENLTPAIYQGMQKEEARLPKTHEEIRTTIADFKLLCFTEVFDNILMWSHYSNEHTGVVLEFSCIEKFDSVWGVAKPVKYMDRMPLLFDEERFVGLMPGREAIGEERIFENAVFVKAIDWAYEREWRIAGGTDKTQNTEDISFYAEEITAVYLGCRTGQQDAADLRQIIDRVYPHASVYRGKKSPRRFALEFSKEK